MGGLLLSIFYSVISVYIFILLGYFTKRFFKEKIDDKTITILNVYILQVFLTFWGLLIKPIDFSLFKAPAIYLSIVFFSVFITALIAKKLFNDKKEYSIATIAAVIGNTGNLGIPLNIAIFGEESIPYTTIINLMNVFVVYTLGVYFYSRGSFDAKTSFKNIFKLPILWAATIAITLSLNGFTPSKVILDTLMMGAYASMTMQLILFGIYLYETSIKDLSKKLISWVMGFKFLFLPLITFFVLKFIDMDKTIKGVLFIELIMPLAVANVNLASLYECKPKVVSSLVLISSLAFLAIVFVVLKIVEIL